VTLVDDGRKAIEAAKGWTFDLILMDVQMPELSGFEATYTLRQLGIATPIVALTAHAMPGYRERCLAAGMDDYISKPVTGIKLMETIQRVLQGLAPRPGSVEPSAPVELSQV
jgi:CheY-like chemotaxis protein